MVRTDRTQPELRLPTFLAPENTNSQIAVNAVKSRINLLDFDEAGLRDFFESIGEKPFRAQQILKWVYHHAETDFGVMTDLGIALREKLNLIALIGFHGGNAVETVYIPEPKRGTLCVSSQVGCALNCSFCSTGAQGFARNLTTGEIIGQVWLAAKALGHERNGLRKITNIVMMGMGEPLLNFDAVLRALLLMRSDLGFGFAAKRVTVSTAGLVPGIYRLRESIDVALAVSLHSPVDDVRVELVPLNRKYPIAELMQACRDFVSEKHKRTVTFEYTLIDGVNDHPEHARKLVKLLRTVPSKLNLIPFNPFPGTQYRCSSKERITRFQEIVMQGGLIATVRKTRGEDIDAACGQLVGKVQDRTKRSERIKTRMAEITP